MSGYGILAVALLVTMPFAVSCKASDVTLSVNGVQPSGKVFGEVFGDESSFKARKSALLRFGIDVDGSAHAHTTLALPPGRYAIALFQDTRHTGKMVTNMFGVPSVPYGFSNNARGSFGPPGFDSAAFTVDAQATALSIDLR